MLPRLSAEESIRATNQIAVGTGNLEKDARRQLVATWSQQSQSNRRPVKASVQQLGAIGIGVRVARKPI
jgi:hypothetical protein